MKLSEEYERLMLYSELPERFRAGDFGLLEDEAATPRDFVDSFYTSVEENGCVTLEDFTEFMDFLSVWGCIREVKQLRFLQINLRAMM